MRTTSARGRSRGAFLLAAACASIANRALAADRHWSPAAPDGSSFRDATKWVEGRVPGTTDRAVFDLPAAAPLTVRFDAAVETDQLLVSSGHLTFELGESGEFYRVSSTSAASIVLSGAVPAKPVTLSVIGGTLAGSAAIFGDAAQTSGTLALSGRGRFSAKSLVLGASAGASGSLTAAPTDSSGGFDTINMSSGMTIGKAGTGLFENRGSFVQTNYLEGDTVLGDAATGHGTVRVGEAAYTGNFAHWTAPGGFVVGNAGAGNVTIFKNSAIASGNHKGVDPDDAYRGDADHPLYVAKLVGSTGTVTVGGLWTHHGPVAVGGTETADGGAGSLTIVTGGSFGNADRPLVIRRDGSVVIDGGTLAVGSIDNSHGGTIDLRSGTLVLTQADLVIRPAGLLGGDVTADSLVARTLRVVAGSHLNIIDGIQTPALTVEGTVAIRNSIVADTIRIATGATVSGAVVIYGLAGDNVDVTVDGTLGSGSGVGRIDLRGAITFGAGSVYTAELGPVPTDPDALAADLLAIEGDLDLSAANDTLHLTSLPGAGDAPHLIATYTGTLKGTFDHVTPGFVIDHRPGEIYVSAVPEPGALSLAVVAATWGARRRRRRGA